jgi:hypothetical protein
MIYTVPQSSEITVAFLIKIPFHGTVPSTPSFRNQDPHGKPTISGFPQG